MFLFKKIVAPLLLPVSLSLEILTIGLVLLWFTRNQRTGKVFVSIGTFLFATLSFGAVSDLVLMPLEYKFPPLVKIENFHDVKWVVVLGGGHVSDHKIPITSQLTEASLVRLVEGIRIQKILPGSRLILSGGGAFDPVPTANGLANVANAIGMEKNDVVLESISKDTKDEAMLIQKIVGSERFFLVTSAYHMPRSMALFRKQGMNPIPAPTDHWVKERQKIEPGVFFPNARSLRKAEMAFREYLGQVWAKIRGQI